MPPGKSAQGISSKQALAFAAALQKAGVSGVMLEDLLGNNDMGELARWIYLRRLSYPSLRNLPFAKDRALVRQEILSVLSGGAEPFAAAPMKLDTLRTIILGRGFDPQNFGFGWMDLYRNGAIHFTGKDRRLLGLTKKGQEILSQLEADTTS